MTSTANTSITDFYTALRSSDRMLALCGAGLSASSGLGTFRGAGGMWRNHKATSLATPEAFERDPGLVWLFYSYRRHKALQANPNAGHYALSELSKKKPNFITLTQNVDGLAQRANHPPSQLKLLHGSLFDIKCNTCTQVIQNDYSDPYHPSLAITSEEDPRLEPAANPPNSDTSSQSSTSSESPSPPPTDPDLTIPRSSLPHCPSCKTGLQRPGVVWFGESLPRQTLTEIDTWLYLGGGRVDLMFVIGTTAAVFPAAGYIEEARSRGARIVVINSEDSFLGTASFLTKRDFLFIGDAAKILPVLLRPVIGELNFEGKEEGENIGYDWVLEWNEQRSLRAEKLKEQKMQRTEEREKRKAESSTGAERKEPSWKKPARWAKEANDAKIAAENHAQSAGSSSSLNENERENEAAIP